MKLIHIAGSIVAAAVFVVSFRYWARWVFLPQRLSAVAFHVNLLWAEKRKSLMPSLIFLSAGALLWAIFPGPVRDHQGNLTYGPWLIGVALIVAGTLWIAHFIWRVVACTLSALFYRLGNDSAVNNQRIYDTGGFATATDVSAALSGNADEHPPFFLE